MKQVLLIMIVLCLAVSSYALSWRKLRKEMENWKGHSRMELYKKMGQPDGVTNDGADGEIHIYARRISQPAVRSATDSGNISEAKDYWEWRMFYTNVNGVIYNWQVVPKDYSPAQSSAAVSISQQDQQ